MEHIVTLRVTVLDVDHDDAGDTAEELVRALREHLTLGDDVEVVQAEVKA